MHLVLARSFKLSTLHEVEGVDEGSCLSEWSKTQLEADESAYSVLMVCSILGCSLLFVLMAPFELARMHRKVTHPESNPYLGSLMSSPSRPSGNRTCVD